MPNYAAARPYGRANLAGLNLAPYPVILIELGNIKNELEVAVMTTAEGRAKYAAAVAQGIAAYFHRDNTAPPNGGRTETPART